MNLLLIKPTELLNGTVVLKDQRAGHIIKNLKSKVGDNLRAGIVDGQIGTASIVEINQTSVTIDFKPEKTSPKPKEVTLILALPRPKAFRRILFSAVSCGVKDIHIINTWRVEKSYWSSPYISADNVEAYCLEALAQSKDTIMPKIYFHRFFTSFIEEVLPTIPTDRARVIAHPYGESIGTPTEPVTIAVGPEGGFIEREVETFLEHGFRSFSTGERTLTTEHFVPFVLGKLLK